MTEEVKCPICGSETVELTSQKGPNAGSSFYVCNRYPECKGKVAISEEEDVEGFIVGQGEIKDYCSLVMLFSRFTWCSSVLSC